MKVYLSGPITARTDYKMVFLEAEKRYSSMGHEVINPASLDDKVERSWGEWIIHDLKRMLDCDAIVLLDGWEKSKGADIELTFARGLKIAVIEDRAK
jgi:hypothetical protein